MDARFSAIATCRRACSPRGHIDKNNKHEPKSHESFRNEIAVDKHEGDWSKGLLRRTSSALRRWPADGDHAKRGDPRRDRNPSCERRQKASLRKVRPKCAEVFRDSRLRDWQNSSRFHSVRLLDASSKLSRELDELTNLARQFSGSTHQSVQPARDVLTENRSVRIPVAILNTLRVNSVQIERAQEAQA